MTALECEFFAMREIPGDLGDLLFVARPGGGARVREL
jgi:hypothetical protein